MYLSTEKKRKFDNFYQSQRTALKLSMDRNSISYLHQMMIKQMLMATCPPPVISTFQSD